jgi:hypothetical protein
VTPASEFPDDGPEEDRPDIEIMPTPPVRPAAPATGARPRQPSSAYPARSRLARQTPQTVLLVGVGLVLLFCVLAFIAGLAGAETAAGLVIVCGGPFALFVIGTGIVLLVTRGRTDHIPK